MPQVTFRASSLPEAIREVLDQCECYVTIAPDDPTAKMTVVFLVPERLRPTIASCADSLETVACDPPCLAVPPQELLRAVGGLGPRLVRAQ